MLGKVSDATMKYILVIGDGMADNPVPELGGKTPLQAANIPTPTAKVSITALDVTLPYHVGHTPLSASASLQTRACPSR